ncbi:MAG TPA: SprB repeat-containing protein, partial [Bacteroidia bacterium]|nr:SprB repeat-containing protein [Bacteroidia bacterium]
TATGLPAGSYSVTVMDANGCISTDNVTITEPSPVQAQASATAALCRSTATGAVSAQAAGGTGPYTYLWMPGSIAGASASNLNAGTYTVTVSDQNGCTSTATASVTQPTAVTASTSTQATQCNGSADGSATVSANGGTPGYTYSWFPTGGNNSTTIGVAAGTYTVTVTDDNGCSITSTAVVGQPAAINVSTSSTPASCGSANGSATASVSGGAGSYSYAWSPGGATGANASGLVAGSYTVIVTDANGCTQTANASVSNIGGPTIATAVVQQVSCFGGNDGSATVNVSTGTAPFSFAWSPAGGSGATATGLSAGNFSVTVTDANGCISNDQVTITEPTALALQTTTQPTLCFGSPSGSADVVVAGGTGPYSYAWAPGGASSASAINLSAGNYTV